jgi:hypothetical protein
MEQSKLDFTSPGSLKLDLSSDPKISPTEAPTPEIEILVPKADTNSQANVISVEALLYVVALTSSRFTEEGGLFPE